MNRRSNWACALALLAGYATSSFADDPSLALHVLNRLGYGPRPGDVDRVAAEGVPHYIETQLAPARIALPAEVTARVGALTTQMLSAGQVYRRYGPPSYPPKNAPEDIQKAARQKQGEIQSETHQARLILALTSPRHLEEVMTEFWFNHFNVFEGKDTVRMWVGHFERSAIRPYALGRFRELLGAVAHHPAMLVYLDNWLSSGVRTPDARGRFSGLNENYARELLELHTLGVDGGYGQGDVVALARILTGWTLDEQGMAAGRDEAFVFAARRHDFGDKVLLGNRIKGTGYTEGERALDILAAHPSTARHIAYKLVQQFVSDAPDAGLVNRVAQRFSASQGDIAATLKALFESPEFLQPTNRMVKFKTPYRYAISALRAVDAYPDNLRPIEGFLHQAAMPLYGWITPDGYRTTEEAWLNPDAVIRRIGLAVAIGAGRWPEPQREPPDPDRVALLLGDVLTAEQRAAIVEAPARQRVGLMLGSPGFMRF